MRHLISFWYWLVSLLPWRVRCFLGHHKLGDSIRLDPLPGVDWKEHEFLSPFVIDGKRDIIKCYRREFAYVQICKDCNERLMFIGYDQKPIESDAEFDRKHKNASTSKGLNLTQEQYEQHVRKLKRENP